MTLGARIKRDFTRNWDLYLILLPVLIYYLVFHYGPMGGAFIAFKDYFPGDSVFFSAWATDFDGNVAPFFHFIDFFTGPFFGRLMANTLRLSLASLLFGFPAPILLALLMNEMRSRWFARTVQTITYMPHFVSLVVICGMVVQFTQTDGFITQILVKYFGAENMALNLRSELFTTIYVASSIWQEVGWGTIIYLAALAGIDQEQYEAARIDGAGRWKQTLYVTLPNLLPQIIILLILRLGNILNVGFERVMLLYNAAVLERADVISTYVYRQGILSMNYSSSAAIGLFNSVLTFALVMAANYISRKVSETSLW